MDKVRFDFSYMFFYSERPGTLAAKNFQGRYRSGIEATPELTEVIEKQTRHSAASNKENTEKFSKY